ncbi:MAG: hypothetical protein RBS73_11770 [Prolixibacteraceae bacterium]|nr:hypothetical protein [Prolixibacteraceae bacterium]
MKNAIENRGTQKSRFPEMESGFLLSDPMTEVHRTRYFNLDSQPQFPRQLPVHQSSIVNMANVAR